jgi:transcriptional regulator with XRE-family HTH domain
MSNGTIDREKVKELLGYGMSQEQVATAIGSTPGYISILMSDEKFSQEVIELRTQKLAVHTRRDESINSIEDKLIEKLGEIVSQGIIYKPADLLRAFAVVNRAERRGQAQQVAPVQQTQVVNLNIPVQVVQKFEISPQGEVVGIDERTLVTMNSSTLLERLKTSGGPNGNKYAEVANFLPGAAHGIPQSKLLTDSGD